MQKENSDTKFSMTILTSSRQSAQHNFEVDSGVNYVFKLLLETRRLIFRAIELTNREKKKSQELSKPFQDSHWNLFSFFAVILEGYLSIFGTRHTE